MAFKVGERHRMDEGEMPKRPCHHPYNLSSGHIFTDLTHGAVSRV
jgi:hypothetical protein